MSFNYTTKLKFSFAADNDTPVFNDNFFRFKSSLSGQLRATLNGVIISGKPKFAKIDPSL